MASLKSNTYELREKLYNRQSKASGKSRLESFDLSNPINSAGTSISGIISDSLQGFVEKTSGLTVGDINKVWRAKILLDRLGGPATGRAFGLPRDHTNTGKKYIPNTVMTGGSKDPRDNDSSHKVHRSLLSKGLYRPKDEEVDGVHYEVTGLGLDQPSTKTFKVASLRGYERNILHNDSKNHRRNEIIIFNLEDKDSYKYIILQNRPSELEFQGETSWATIKSFGRNVPMYHFTGAEDKIQLQISWYCNDPERPWEVVQKCRLLEAWTKADGYYAGPPILNIDWGGSGLFDNAYFILTSATYVLKNFRDGYIDRRLDNPTWQDGKLYPMAATQELIFNRVSGTNPMHSSIYDPSKIEGIKGVSISGISTSGDGTIMDGRNNGRDNNSLWQ